MGKFTLLLVATLVSTAVLSDVYRWKDASGQVHFSDHENLPHGAEQVERVEVRPNVVTTPSSRASAIPRQQRPRASTTGKPRARRVQQQARSVDFKEAKCRRAEQGLARIRSIMRAGYKASEQARLHASELRYMKDRQKFCD